MTTLPKFDETEITIENDIITIKQSRYYNYHSIEIPVSLWATFAHAIDREIEKTPAPDSTSDLAGEAFHLLESMNRAKAEQMK